MGTARALSMTSTELVELVVDLHRTSWGRSDRVRATAARGCTGGPQAAHAVAPRGQRRDERASTGAGTSPSTSPPKATTSLIRLEDRKE